MSTFIRKPATCEAMLLSDDNAEEVADWCEGVAMPDGVVMFPTGARAWSPATPGVYVAREAGRLRLMSAADFEREWEDAED